MEISWVRWLAGLAQSVCSRFRGNPVSKVRQRAIEEDTSILDLKPPCACTHTCVHIQGCTHRNVQTCIHYIHTISQTSFKDNLCGRHICLDQKLQDRLYGGKRIGGQAGTPRSLSLQQKQACLCSGRGGKVPAPTWGLWDAASVRRAGWSLADLLMP